MCFLYLFQLFYGVGGSTSLLQAGGYWPYLVVASAKLVPSNFSERRFFVLKNYEYCAQCTEWSTCPPDKRSTWSTWSTACGEKVLTGLINRGLYFRYYIRLIENPYDTQEIAQTKVLPATFVRKKYPTWCPARRKVMSASIQCRSRGVILGGMCGDTLGAAVEGWPPTLIKRLAEKNGWSDGLIHDFIKAVHMGTYVKVKDENGACTYKAGATICSPLLSHDLPLIINFTAHHSIASFRS